MREKIEYYLNDIGYKKLSAAIPGFTIFFELENGYVNAIMLVDRAGNPDMTKEQYDAFRTKTSWRFMDGGCIEVHMLSVILTDDLAAAEALNADDRFGWVILCQENRLVIEEGKAEDFYGMKGKLQDCLSRDMIPQDGQLQAMEYDAKGKPYYKSFKQRPFVNHWLFVLNAILFTGCVLTGNLLYEVGMLSYEKVMEGEWYRIFSSMFLHADMSHLVGNMLILYYLGEIVERSLGHFKYLVLYLVSGVAASFASMAYSYLTQEYTASLGASGAIFGMVGALLWVAIRNRGHAEIMTVGKVLFMIGYTLYSGFRSTNVDNAAHVGGLLAGFVLAVLLYHTKRDKKSHFLGRQEKADV